MSAYSHFGNFSLPGEDFRHRKRYFRKASLCTTRNVVELFLNQLIIYVGQAHAGLSLVHTTHFPVAHNQCEIADLLNRLTQAVPNEPSIWNLFQAPES